MKTSTIVWIVIIVLVLLGAWYWWPKSSAPYVPTPAPAPSSEQSQNSGAVSNNLALGTNSNAKLGTYLIGYNGMTLYTKSSDKAGVSTCYGDCAKTWPPYTVPAGTTLNLQAGVGGTAGTITRTDGTVQVTYNGKPLYFYTKDKDSSDAYGQGVGGVWAVVKP